MENLFSLTGKVAVVTGGARGIGRMIAEGFVRSGVRTYIVSRKREVLLAAEDDLNQLGECVAIQADLSTLAAIKTFVAELHKREEKIDILVNNAGATWGEGFESFPESGWDKVMDLNLKSPFFLFQQLLPLLEASADADDPARVINISSVNGITTPSSPNYSYSASKAALIHLTQHLAADMVRKHININSIAPGFFHTDMMSFAIDGHEAEFAASIPRGRLGNQKDMAGTAIYLVSRASAWMTGQTLVLDGGHVACAR